MQNQAFSIIITYYKSWSATLGARSLAKYEKPDSFFWPDMQ